MIDSGIGQAYTNEQKRMEYAADRNVSTLVAINV